ncbi:MAG: bifunctional nicotinamidase/pyrazinamidase [Spirochaetales bacterium]|nr:bifunctional nicotinamidase/pyrazinamidase [Spirochaetales bacterium]MCF7937835.1 bifunctional nicotinamidase/pyrazinamidase [Spirochaetales bacterium]
MAKASSPSCKSVLLIVDLQPDFCTGGPLEVPGGEQIVPVVNRISRLFDRVIATRDWHPKGHVSFASRHQGSAPLQTIEYNGIEQILWPDHCIAGSAGARLHPDLDTRPLDLILDKGRSIDLDSYSAFFENDHRTPTGLHGYLRELSGEILHICGLAADVCVYYSVMDALDLGYQVYVVEDAIRGVDMPEGTLNKRINAMQESGAEFIRSTALGHTLKTNHETGYNP